MGLDMFLFAWSESCNELDEAKDENDIYDNILPIIFKELNWDDTVYWRKANMIHGWLTSYGHEYIPSVLYRVSREDVQKLIKTCEEILALKDKAHNEVILPTCSGFFFGNTEYDSYYYEKVSDSIEALTTFLKQHPNTESFLYYASF